MSMNGDGTSPESLRQSRLAVEALASDMARALVEASQNEGENQVNFIFNQLVRLYVLVADLRAANTMLQEKLQPEMVVGGQPPDPVPAAETEVVGHPTTA